MDFPFSVWNKGLMTPMSSKPSTDQQQQQLSNCVFLQCTIFKMSKWLHMWLTENSEILSRLWCFVTLKCQHTHVSPMNWAISLCPSVLLFFAYVINSKHNLNGILLRTWVGAVTNLSGDIILWVLVNGNQQVGPPHLYCSASSSKLSAMVCLHLAPGIILRRSQRIILKGHS